MSYTSTFWFTGLSGSGKTTIASRAAQSLSEKDKKIEILDGDVIRKEIHGHLGFTPEDIKENNRLIAELCVKRKGLYDYIFVPIISPFAESRSLAREIIKDNFYIIYCKATLETVMERDVKGLYKRALSGGLDNLIGVDKRVPYEPPQDADLILDTAREDIEISVGRLIGFISSKEKDGK